jgi:hypothetical protein
MRTLAIALLAGVSALAASGARADEVITTTPNPDLVQVRTVCNEYGRCWHEPGDRVIIRRSYDYYPGDRYEYRRYHDYGPGVHFRAPGVDVGVGVDRY